MDRSIDENSNATGSDLEPETKDASGDIRRDAHPFVERKTQVPNEIDTADRPPEQLDCVRTSSSVAARSISIAVTEMVATSDLQAGDNLRGDDFDVGDLAQGLAEGIPILHPVLARRMAGTQKGIIVCGERRWKAAIEAGLGAVPVRWVECDGHEAAKLGLLENLSRKALPDEFAALARLYDLYEKETPVQQRGGDHKSAEFREGKSNCSDCTLIPSAYKRVADAIGVSERTARQKVNIGKATSELRNAVIEGLIKQGDAEKYAGLPPEEQRRKVAMVRSLHGDDTANPAEEQAVSKDQSRVPRKTIWKKTPLPDLIDEVKEALDDGKICSKAVARISKLPRPEQIAQLAREKEDARCAKEPPISLPEVDSPTYQDSVTAIVRKICKQILQTKYGFAECPEDNDLTTALEVVERSFCELFRCADALSESRKA